MEVNGNVSNSFEMKVQEPTRQQKAHERIKFCTAIEGIGKKITAASSFILSEEDEVAEQEIRDAFSFLIAIMQDYADVDLVGDLLDE